MEILDIKNENQSKKKFSRWIWFHIQNVISLEVITPTLKKKEKVNKLKTNDFSRTQRNEF